MYSMAGKTIGSSLGERLHAVSQLHALAWRTGHCFRSKVAPGALRARVRLVAARIALSARSIAHRPPNPSLARAHKKNLSSHPDAARAADHSAGADIVGRKAQPDQWPA